jgi:prepilin-type N-terminal cleavage/methylation domain-containing protein
MTIKRKKMMFFKQSRSSKGFTLVEAIVVGVIVAILAAVAMPMYANYVTQTKQDAVNNLAETAAAAGNIYYRRMSSDPNLAQLNLTYDAMRYIIVVTAPNVTVTYAGSSITSTKAYR